MTVEERIDLIVNSQQTNLEIDSVEKLVYIAYYIGRERASKEICDKCSNIFKTQIEAAKASRYHKLAMQIQGNISHIYSDDYAGDIKSIFGKDKTDI